MEASLLVLLSATVARGLLASAFALVNERRLCSSRASTSGSSRCRTDDLLHAPRAPARRGIEARPRGPLRLFARGVDGDLGAAARRGASPGRADGSHLPAASASAEELIAAIGLEPRHAHSRRHLELLQDLSCSRIDPPQIALVAFPGAVPELAVDPGDPGDEAV